MSRLPNPGTDRLTPWSEVPPGIQQRIGPALPAGHAVWACPSRDGRGGVHTEWWWLDEHGELIEAFWFE